MKGPCGKCSICEMCLYRLHKLYEAGNMREKAKLRNAVAILKGMTA